MGSPSELLPLSLSQGGKLAHFCSRLSTAATLTVRTVGWGRGGRDSVADWSSLLPARSQSGAQACRGVAHAGRPGPLAKLFSDGGVCLS